MFQLIFKPCLGVFITETEGKEAVLLLYSCSENPKSMHQRVKVNLCLMGLNISETTENELVYIKS